MKAIQFGAGNIGRGFIGDLLYDSGYHTTFVEVNEELVDYLNRNNSYNLYLLERQYEKKVIENIKALSPITQENKIIKEIIDCDLITTSVWANNLDKIAPVIAKGLRKRLEHNKDKINIIACENAMHGSEKLKKLIINNDPELEVHIDSLASFPNTAVDRIVLDAENDKFGINVAEFHELAIERNKLANENNLPIKGAKYTDNLTKFLERKLYVVNAGHAWAGFIGYIYGFTNVKDVFLNEELVKDVRKAMMESSELIYKKYDFSKDEMAEYVDFGIKRYQQEGVDYEVNMVTRSPIRKLGYNDRLVGPAVQLEARGLDNEFLLRGIALVLLLDRSDDEEAVVLQNYLSKNGLDKTIVNYTNIDPNSKMINKIKEYYIYYKNIKEEHNE